VLPRTRSQDRGGVWAVPLPWAVLTAAAAAYPAVAAASLDGLRPPAAPPKVPSSPTVAPQGLPKPPPTDRSPFCMPYICQPPFLDGGSGSPLQGNGAPAAKAAADPSRQRLKERRREERAHRLGDRKSQGPGDALCSKAPPLCFESPVPGSLSRPSPPHPGMSKGPWSISATRSEPAAPPPPQPPKPPSFNRPASSCLGLIRLEIGIKISDFICTLANALYNFTLYVSLSLPAFKLIAVTLTVWQLIFRDSPLPPPQCTAVHHR